MITKRQTKLQHAVSALARISFLDMKASSSLADAVQIAEQALRDIDRDELLIRVQTDDANKILLRVGSAAGNEAIARELIPYVQQLIDAIAVDEGSAPIAWAEWSLTPRNRPAEQPPPADR